MEYISTFTIVIALILDSLLGDPVKLPHPIVLFGKAISKGEKLLNKGTSLLLKGALLSLLLIALSYAIPAALFHFIHGEFLLILNLLLSSILLFYCLANRTLIIEGVAVFRVLEQEGIEAGRIQLARIVGRDTSELTAQQIRVAVLETMSENLSDGVIAPLFYFALLGVPGALAYKMVNTLDSMIGYKSERYEQFGKVAARIDDIFNFIPARITALLILVVSGKPHLIFKVFREGRKHASPNAGFPEAALALVLKCQFGGPNCYFGTIVEKPFIGSDNRLITDEDIKKCVRVNILSTLLFSFGIALIPFV